MPSGPRVLFASPFVPPEWIAAHALQPCRLVPDRLAEGPLIRPQEGLCPFAQSVANVASQDSRAVGTIFTTTCDQMRRIFEEISTASAPSFLLNVPVNPSSPAGQELYRYELLRLSRWLCGLGGQVPSHEQLAHTIKQYSLKRNQRTRLSSNLPASAAAKCWMEFHANPDSDGATHLSQAALNSPPLTGGGRGGVNLGPKLNGPPLAAGLVPAVSVKRAGPVVAPLARQDAGPGGRPDLSTARVPLALVGGPLTRAEMWLCDFLAECGADVTLDATEFGPRCRPASFDPDLLIQDPLAALVQAYASIPDLFQRPNAAFYAWLDGQFAARPVRGLVILRWLWCDLWAAESARLAERYQLPSAVIELTGHDSARGSIQTRLAALVESLKHD